jgi:hypothetical protein
MTGELAFTFLITRIVRANCWRTLIGTSTPYSGAKRIARPLTMRPS